MRLGGILVRVAALIAIGTAAARSAEPIRIHPANPRYFEWRGKAVALITSAEHYGSVLNREFDHLRYLDALQRDGMNYTRIFSGSYVEPAGAFGIQRNTLAPARGRFLAPWARSETPGYPGGGNKFNLDRWDPEYLARLKAFVKAAAERGIVVELTLFCATYGDAQWKLSPFHPDNNVNGTNCAEFRKLNTLSNGNVLNHQRALVRYLAKELNGFDNLIYEIQNEPWADDHDLGEWINPYLRDRNGYPNRVEIPKPASVAWQAEIARALRETEETLPHKHLFAQNIANFQLSVRSADLAPGVSPLNFHYAYPAAATRNGWLRRPVGCDETGFLGPDDAPYRREAWEFLLSGGGVFNNLDYSFSVGYEDGSDSQPQSPGGGSPALRKQLRVLAEFLNGFDLARLEPHPDVVLRSPGATTYCLATPGVQYAFYLRGRSSTELAIELPAGAYRAEWIDVRDGSVVSSEEFLHESGERTIASPEFDEEIALRIVKQVR